MTVNRRQILSMAAFLPFASRSWAQEAPYPTKPVSLILPYPPGGQTDSIARFLARNLEVALGQPFIVDNRPGANSLIGTNLVAKAVPDGHTLLLNMTALVSNTILLPNINYDPLGDFVPIARLYELPAIWAVPPNGPSKLEDFVAQARAAKHPLSFGTTGHASSSHYFGEMFARASGFQLNHIPYKGEGPLLPDLISGRLDAAVVSSAAALTYGKDGRIRTLAVSGPRRWKALPDLPTFLELGVPGMTTETFCGIFAPARTPKPVIDKLHAAINGITATKAFQDQMHAMGLEVAPVVSPEAFADLMKKSQKEWVAIKKEIPID